MNPKRFLYTPIGLAEALILSIQKQNLFVATSPLITLFAPSCQIKLGKEKDQKNIEKESDLKSNSFFYLNFSNE